MRICVIGAGNGGQALAGVLAQRGHEVMLFNRSEKRISGIVDNRTLRLEGESSGPVKLAYVGTNIEKAIKNCQIVMIVVPAFAHASVAERIAPYIEAGQIIILNPGRTGGALEFKKVLDANNAKPGYVIAEAQTFLFASRIAGPGLVRIFRMKNAVPVSALPAKDNHILSEALPEVFPEFVIAPNVLYTSFNNIGAVFHPAALLMNAGWIETTHGNFQFYLDGISPSVARVLTKIDEERCEIARALKIEPLGAVEWLDFAYDVKGRDLYEAIHNNDGYQGIRAPVSLYNRYILEDVPMSLVPISYFGKSFGINTTTIDSIINIANVVMGINYWEKGRNMDSLGLSGLSINSIWDYVEMGVKAL